jgi:hypothetical protein
MKTFIALGLVAVLSGCASGCHTACIFGIGPGNSIFDNVGLAADRADECQTGAGNEARRIQLGRPVGYTAPEWCYANKTRARITNRYGHTIGYVK